MRSELTCLSMCVRARCWCGALWGEDVDVRQLLTRIFWSKVYVPVALCVICILFTATSVSFLSRLGDWPPPFLQARPAIVIQQAVVLTPTPVPQVDVAVLGAVRQPGLYGVPANGHVRDAVAMAGGLLTDADVARLDLAAPVTPGAGIYVPRIGEALPTLSASRVNLNTASVEDLHNALGLSLTTARKIVSYRAKHGPFSAVNQLLLVPVSLTIYDRIQLLVTV